MPDGLRDVAEAADWLGIPPKTLQNLVCGRRVPFSFIGKHVRFSQEHLDAIVAAGQQEVVGGRRSGRTS